jgi:hypothetical protein
MRKNMMIIGLFMKFFIFYFFFYFLWKLLNKIKLHYPTIFKEVLVLRLLREIIFCDYKTNYITQGYSLHSFKSSRGVGFEIVERDNIL